MEDKTTPVSEQPANEKLVEPEAPSEKPTDAEAVDFEGPRELPEDEPEEKNEPELGQTNIGESRWRRFRHLYGSKKKVSIPLTILAALIIIGAIPFSRFALAGLFIRQDVQVQVLDSKTGAPVSSAQVQASLGATETTNGTGYATLHKLKPGKINIKITKKYYQDGNLKATVGIFGSPKALKADLQATGRQVKVKVTNVITKKGLANVAIKVSDIDAMTDSSGNASIVLPAGSTEQKAILKLNGYNDAEVKIQLSDTEVKENQFNLVPAGRIYFLSNRTGKIDVMKANLDGSNPVVVLAGTGSEDANNTILVASLDWKYLALLSKRGSAPKLYVISTSDDQLTIADEGSANFTISGWLGNNLIFTVSRTDLSPWKTGAGKLKSYDANTGKLTLLDQTNGAGDAASNTYEYYGLVFPSGDSVIFGKGWTSQNAATADYSGKQETLSTISVTGQNHQVVAKYDSATKSVYYTPHAANAIYVVESTDSQPSANVYYDYLVGSTPKQISLSNDQLYKAYSTYYPSPDGKQTLWSEDRDGNAVLIGDAAGGNGKVVIKSSNAYPLGWFTSHYILLTKDGNELDILGVDGGTPLKITNFLSTSYYGLVPQGSGYR